MRRRRGPPIVTDVERSAAARATAAARSVATSLGLVAEDDAVLQDSNKLVLRLLPCDVLARVAPVGEQVAGLEVDVARRLATAGSPVASLDPRVEPRVHERDGFVVTLWTYHEPTTSSVAPADYAEALARLHEGMRGLDVAVPHALERVASARRLVASSELTPGLDGADRELLADVLRDTGRSVAGSGRDQLLHGEPHPGNVLATASGPLFIDFETCCRGPVEFDLAHAPEEVDKFYPGADPVLLEDCRLLVLAMVTTWRWDVGDQFPDGRRLGVEWLERVRVGAAQRRRRRRG